MNTNIKGYLLSTLITFIAVFATYFFTAIQVPGFTFSKSSLLGLAVAAVVSGVRAAAKLIVEYFASVTTNPVPVPPNNTPLV
jgi:hypothetical protein